MLQDLAHVAFVCFWEPTPVAWGCLGQLMLRHLHAICLSKTAH